MKKTPLQNQLINLWNRKNLIRYVNKKFENLLCDANVDLDFEQKKKITSDLLVLLKVLQTLPGDLLENIANERVIKTLLIDIIYIYCHARLNKLGVTLIGHSGYVQYKSNSSSEDKVSVGSLLRNFGICSTKKGPNREVDNKFIELFMPAYSGGILSCERYTPLLNIIWAIAVTDAAHDIYFVGPGSSKVDYLNQSYLWDANESRVRMTAIELFICSRARYQLIDGSRSLTPGLICRNSRRQQPDKGERENRLLKLFNELKKLINTAKINPSVFSDHVCGKFSGP